ncbi:MAG: alpha/beta hydrolase [Hyphomonadaceae bacterium]|nr:alpha/beta hydrolase [Hyphomonadaceae bacterium]
MSIVAALFMVLFFNSCGQTTEAPISASDSPYFSSSDRIVIIDGVGLRVRDEGPQDARTLVLVHGFTSSLETWDALANDLKKDYRVIRLDLPGHGLTGPDPKERYSNEDTVLILQKLINKLELENPVLVGNSLGGLVSWRAATENLENVSGLVLIAPSGFSINGVTEQPQKVPAMVKIYLTKAPAAGVKQATRALFADPEKLPDQRIQDITYMMQRPGNGEAFVKRAESFTLPDPVQDIGKVKAPTLIVWGDRDVMVPSAHGQKFLEAMTSAELLVYENTGHVPQEEKPRKLALDIRAFLSKQD